MHGLSVARLRILKIQIACLCYHTVSRLEFALNVYLFYHTISDFDNVWNVCVCHHSVSDLEFALNVYVFYHTSTDR